MDTVKLAFVLEVQVQNTVQSLNESDVAFKVVMYVLFFKSLTSTLLFLRNQLFSNKKEWGRGISNLIKLKVGKRVLFPFLKTVGLVLTPYEHNILFIILLLLFKNKTCCAAQINEERKHTVQ